MGVTIIQTRRHLGVDRISHIWTWQARNNRTMWVALRLGHSTMNVLLGIYSRWLDVADQRREVSKLKAEFGHHVRDEAIVILPRPVTIARMATNSVLAAVIQRHGKYLVCQRPLHKRHGGLWEFPGGKLETGETYFDAAQRELVEELGLLVLAIGSSLFSIADPGSEFVIDFVPTEVDGEPQCLEHLDLKWTALEDLTSLRLAPSDRRFVEFLHTVKPR